MKITFVTLGCKVNLCESQGLMQLAQKRGYKIVQCDADAVVVNSCAVTAVSEHKNIRAIHKARKENPNAVIAVIGCMAQTNADKLLLDGTANLICGVTDRASVLDACENAVRARMFDPRLSENRKINSIFEELPAGIPAGRTRALLKVEDGCNNFCSYCVIPYARGRVRSLAPDKAVEEAQRLSREGVHEIVVTGIEISSYGQDLTPRIDLIALIEHLCTACPETRFRLGSLEPRTVTEDFCERLSRFENLAPHFHLSLQSGSDSVLERMNRKYTCEMFRFAVQRLRSKFQDCSITSDVIVGFPGETKLEFEQTCTFIKEIAFADLHVFPYSVRPGTKAADMPGQVSENVKKQRADTLRDLSLSNSENYRKQFIGRKLNVLPEHCDSNGIWSAHSIYNFPIYIKDDRLQKNRPVTALMKELFRDGLVGKLDLSLDK